MFIILIKSPGIWRPIQKWSKKTYDPEMQDRSQKKNHERGKIVCPQIAYVRTNKAPAVDFGSFYIKIGLCIAIADCLNHAANVVQIIGELPFLYIFSQQIAQNPSEVLVSWE
jgi:hypothetical protein